MSYLVMLIVFSQLPKQASAPPRRDARHELTRLRRPWLVKPLVSAISSQVKSAFLMPNIRTNFKYIDENLKDKEFLVGGKLTGADIMLSYPCEGAPVFPASPDLLLTALQALHVRREPPTMKAKS